MKTIGDALMLRIPDTAKAVQLGLRITHELLRGHGSPAVRVGLHHGPAIERGGDYFGAAVNLNLDQDSTETPAALADALGRLLAVSVFADAARDHGRQGDP